MTPAEAVERINEVLAHAWMVRNFLKHADEVQDNEDLLSVHRMIFDYVRAVEPSHERGDDERYLRRAQGKLPKLQAVAELLARTYPQVSTHTNFQMASLSLSACVRRIEEILGAVQSAPSKASDPNP